MNLNIQKESLKEKIANILMQRIVDGELALGDKIREAHLAKEFGVSQAPVREAIISLVSLGILEHKPNVGAKVKEFTKAEIIEIYQVREALESFAVSQNSHALSAISELENIYSEMLKIAKTEDSKAFVKVDQLFHATLIRSLNNVLIEDLWTQQYTKSSVQNVIQEFSGTLEDVAKMHLPIIEAIKEQSLSKSVDAVHVHYKNIYTNYIKEN